MEIEKAKIKDLQNIKALMLEIKEDLQKNEILVWDDGYPNIDILTEDIKNAKGYIVTEKGNIVGYGAIFEEVEWKEFVQEKGNTIYPSRIMVSPKYRKRGIGRFLFKYFEGLGYEYIVLLVHCANTGALAFYNKIGYLVISDIIISYEKEMVLLERKIL